MHTTASLNSFANLAILDHAVICCEAQQTIIGLTLYQIY